MTETEAAASPVTRWRRIDVYADAVRWDGSPEVLTVLADWGAEPTLEHNGPEGVLRVWGHWDRYAGASPGDWLARDPRRGVSRLSPGDFAERFGDPDAGGFAAGTGERDACELLLDRAQKDLDWARRQLDNLAAALRESKREASAAARLERDRIRALAVTHGALCVCRCGLEDLPDPKPGHQRMFAALLCEPPTADAEIGASLRETLSAGVVIGPPDLNNGRPSVWSGACAPGGMVCAVPDPGNPDGICGMPVESEPCTEHEEAEGNA